MQKGELRNSAWSPMTSDAFFRMRLARDLVLAYYAHPTAWSEIGWGGPASPRGYVRMDYDERDPWEAAEVRDGDDRSRTSEERPCQMIPSLLRAPLMAARPMCSVPADGFRCGNIGKTSSSISSSWVPARAAERLLAALPSTASPSSRWMGAPIFDHSRISHRTSPSRPSYTGRMTASSMAPIRCKWAATTAAKPSAGRPCTSRWFRFGFVPNGSNRAACSAMAPTGRSIGAKCGATTPRSRTR